MSEQETEESLGIFWEGEEVEGFTAYGLTLDREAVHPDFPAGVWPPSTEFKSSELTGERWRVWVWDVRIHEWPDRVDWEETIQQTLQRLIDASATVAWCGLEGMFAAPPRLFHPDEMRGGVWAALTSSKRFLCPAHIGDCFRTIGDSELLELRQEAGLGET